MKPNWVIIVLATILLISIIFLSGYQHMKNEKIFLSHFQEYQLLHADHVAEKIKTLLRAYEGMLEAFPLFTSNLRENIEHIKRDIKTYSGEEKDFIDEISFHDKKGITVYSTNSKVVGLREDQNPFFLWAQQKENRGKIFISVPLRKEGNSATQVQPKSRNANDTSVQNFKISLALPIYNQTPSESPRQYNEKFSGVLSFVIDLNRYLADESRDRKIGPLHVWIMDKEGRLLFHSGHPHVESANVRQRDETCNRCHASFSHIDEILERGKGAIDYQGTGASTRLLAFTTVKFGDLSWTVVNSSSYEKASAFIRKGLRQSWELLGIVVLSFVLGSAYLMYSYGRKVRAEEESKHLQEQIADRQQAEEVLRESETKYRIVADNTYDWEWWRDPEGNFIYVSPSCKKVTHHEAEEFIRDADLLLRIIHPDDKSSFIRHQTEIEEKHSAGEVEFRILRPDGSLRWIAHGCQPVFDEQGHFLGHRGSNRDVTEHKGAEGALRESEKQRRHLSSQLLTAQETERRRISRELHDELGGALAVLKLRCSSIERNLQEKGTGLREACKQNLEHIDQIIEDVGRLSRDLSPSILEDLGLSAALRRLIENFSKNYNIAVGCDTIDIDDMFRKDTHIMVYRIFQEALTNIGKHAQAKNISVKVKRDEDIISFLIVDDGKGFDVKHAAMKEGSERGLGLATMDERARMLGGSFDLWSEEGKGTRITLTIPIKKRESVR